MLAIKLRYFSCLLSKFNGLHKWLNIQKIVCYFKLMVGEESFKKLSFLQFLNIEMTSISFVVSYNLSTDGSKYWTHYCVTLQDHHPSMLASPYSNVSSIPHHPLTNHHDVHRRQVLCTIVCLYSAPSYLKNSLLIFHIKSTIIMIFSHQVAISSMCVRRTTRLFLMMIRIVTYMQE